jgi:hypothetical protein
MVMGYLAAEAGPSWSGVTIQPGGCDMALLQRPTRRTQVRMTCCSKVGAILRAAWSARQNVMQDPYRRSCHGVEIEVERWYVDLLQPPLADCRDLVDVL